MIKIENYFDFLYFTNSSFLFNSFNLIYLNFIFLFEYYYDIFNPIITTTVITTITFFY